MDVCTYAKYLLDCLQKRRIRSDMLDTLVNLIISFQIAMDSQQIIATLLYTIFCAQILPSACGFFYFAWKGIQPAKARSKVLLFAQFFGLFFFCTFYWLKLLRIGGCGVTFSTGWLFPYVLISAVFVRVLRLLIIFNLNRSRLLDTDKPVVFKLNVSSNNKGFIANPKLVSELYLFLMFAAIFSFFIAYRIFTISYQVTVTNLPASEACGSPAPYFGMTGLGVILIGLVIVGYKLRKVHDAYYIKTEFTVMMGIALVFLPLYIMTIVLKGTPYLVGCWGILITCNVLAVVSYGVPCYLSIKNIRETKSQSSGDSSTINPLTPATSKDALLPDEPQVGRVPFQGYTKAREWIGDPIAMRYITKYIVHYQNLQSGDHLLLWTQLNEFSKANEEFLTAKASLLYQKFIKKDAYRFIKFITDEQREKIESLLEAAMKEDAPPITREVFDDIMEETESLLIKDVFKGFYQSVFYREYKEAVVLSTNL